MVKHAPNNFAFDTPGPSKAFRIPQLSPEDSDCDDDLSPCRPRTQNSFKNASTVLQDMGSRANVQANYNRAELNLGDMMADLTETCHISTGKQQQQQQNLRSDSIGATHAGRASSLPYPPPLFRNVDSLHTALHAASASSSSLQSPLESPVLSAAASPTSVPCDNPFDMRVRTGGDNTAKGYLSSASLVSPSVCTELESELGSEGDTDMDSETEPDTEAEQEACIKTRRQQLLQNQLPNSQHQSRPSIQPQFYKHFNAQVNPAHTSEGTASASHQARETSTPMLRPRYMYHASNRSAIGISFSENDDDNSEEVDAFNNDNTSPAPAPRALRSSFSKAVRMWMPPSKVRRTQSMFATPEQLLHEQVGHIGRPLNRFGQAEENFTGIVGSPICPLSTYTVKQDPFKRIDHRTLCKLLDGEFNELFSEVVVIDCRFEYEYEGGHISGAVNVNSKKQLEQVLFDERDCNFDQSVLLVFHCEHSAYRSPLLASHLRQWDRHINAPHYPKLFYPDVVVLDGGYSEFYASSANRCEPQNYVGMDHQEHRETCEREMLKFRSGMRARKMPTTLGGGSTPNLLDFRFPKPSPALRSASVADLDVTNNKPNDDKVFGF